MATIKISSTDVHLIETDDGNISITFRVISHEDFLANLSKNNAEMVRYVTQGISNLKIIKDDVEVPTEQTLDAVCTDPGLTNWLYDEYQVFWRKKALTKHSKPLPDDGQVATPAAA